MTQLEHLQNVILSIAKDVDELCRRNNIEYYLLGGSAIGAIRHKGFIPWDDDLDIIMDSNNYERFLKVCKEQKKDVFVVARTANKSAPELQDLLAGWQGEDPQELADALKGSDIPVLVKNPVNPDLELWIGALERLVNAGVTNVGVILRGFSTYDQKIYRNLPLWHIPIELRRRYPNITMFCDPSHIGGTRELVAPISQQAMDLKFDGLMIESHCNPEMALTDAEQQITPDDLKSMIDSLVIHKTKSNNADFLLQELRNQIDNIDEELLQLLARRSDISSKIGVIKKENNLAVLQLDRWNSILSNHIEKGKLLGLKESLVKEIFEAIHKDSIDRQL